MPTLIGVIQRHGTKACREGASDIEFHGLYWQAGWVDLVVDDALVDNETGKILALTGAPADEGPKTAPIPEDRSPEHCPIPQMRTDMVQSVDGMRFRRGNEPDLAAFRVTDAAPYTGLQATRDGEQVTLRFDNSLATMLNDVELQAHYEGCYGKPGTQRRSEKTARLAPGASVTLSVPALLEDADAGNRPARKGGSARHYRLAAILVSGTGEDTWVTIDVSPTALGLDVPPCPGRR